MCSSRQRGFSLLEAVIFIVVLGIGIAGMAVLYNQITQASVDPLIRKQALAIANSLMEEIQLRGFTFCDPDDPAVVTAANPAACDPLRIENIGPENFAPFGLETRSGATPLDNVNDYHGFSMAGIADANNNAVAGLGGYNAIVTVANAGGDFPAAVPVDAALLITVRVDGPANVIVTLQGYRLRYAPNAP
jgi:MSHA pilin protein MshD